MAPHLGVSQSAKIGYYSRVGQDIDSTACGAAVGAFNLCSNKLKADLPDFNNLELSADHQMDFIISEINKKIEKILEKKNPNEQQAEITRQVYEIAKNKLDKILTTIFGDGKLVVLSGIQINMPLPSKDYFQPIEFYVL